jgi:hypothetical protein
MLVIRSAQLEALGAGLVEAFTTRATRHVAERFPGRYASLGEERVRESVSTALRKRLEYAFDGEELVLAYLDAMYVLAFDFDTQPAFAWARGILGDAELTGETRIALLTERARKEARA